MPSIRTVQAARACVLAAVACLASCNVIAGLDGYHVVSQAGSAAVESGACRSHKDCKAQAASDAGAYPTDFCLRSTQRCVALKSQDCATVSGPADDDEAILIGSLFSTSGSQAAVNLARQRSAILAASEINAVGGVPSDDQAGKSGPLVLVSCDESSDAVRAANHLVNDLHVAAIVGPNNSQDDIDIAMQVTANAGTLTLSPTAVAESIAELRDDDLSWQMVPTDAQRGTLLLRQINDLERGLRAQRDRDLKLGIIFRDDALGIGTRATLTELSWNGSPLSAAGNLGSRVKVDSYDANVPVQTDLVQTYAAFEPDVVVLVGAGDAISSVMAPLEATLADKQRPEYVLIDSSKVPELLTLVAANPELRQRVRGTGVTPSPQSAVVYQSFLIDYQARYPDDVQSTSSGLGPSYDATYAIAYAMVASQGRSGKDIARGLRRLSSGDVLELGPTNVLAAFRRLRAAQPITAIGTFSALAWDDRGAIAAGTIEIWCVDVVNGEAVFTSSGWTATIPDQTLSGDNSRCGVHVAATATASASHPQSAGNAAPPPSAAGAGGTGAAGTSAAGSGGASTPEDAGMSMPDAGMSAPPSEPPGPIPCITLECQRDQGEYCCVADDRGSRGTCETETKSCAMTLRCSSDSECGHGQICCVNANKESQCRAASSCGGDDKHLACDSPMQCGDGQVCCAVGDADELRATECARECEDAAGRPSRVCTHQADCAMPGSCVRSVVLPTIGFCL